MKYVIYLLLLFCLLATADRNAELLGLWLVCIMFVLIFWAVWFSLMVFVKPSEPENEVHTPLDLPYLDRWEREALEQRRRRMGL